MSACTTGDVKTNMRFKPLALALVVFLNALPLEAQRLADDSERYLELRLPPCPTRCLDL